MSLFAKRKDLGVQSFVLKLINNSCPGRTANFEGNRANSRVNLAVVIMIIPIRDGKLEVDRAFSAVTKEFSNTGVAVMLEQPCQLDQVVLGFHFEGEMTFIRGEVKHRTAMGGGFHQVGLQLIEVLTPADYPELESMGL